MVIRKDRGFTWIPRPSRKLYTSVLINNTEMKTKVLSCIIERAVTDRVGTCEIRIYNKNGTYTGQFKKKHIIKIYIDYTDGTTQVFEGYVRDVDYELDSYSVLVIKGYDYMGEALKNPVNKQYTTATAISTIFTELISTYLPTHTTTNVATISTTATPTFNNKDLLDCLRDLMKLTNNNYCFYCDFNKDWHVFEKGSVFNATEPILHTKNLLRLKTEDTLKDIATKITLYGQPKRGVPMFVTVSDIDAIAEFGTIHEVLKDTNITIYDALSEKAAEILERKKSGEIKGKRAIVKGMIGLTPGDTVYIFAPDQGLQGEYFIPEFAHEIRGRQIMKTTCKFQVQHKRTEDLSTLFKDRIEERQELINIDNPNDMENTYNFTFDDDTNCNHSNTETGDGKLRLVSGQTSGTMTSDAHISTDNITQVELRTVGLDLRGSTFEISVDNGITWQTVVKDTIYDATATGKYLKVRANLILNDSNPDPSIDVLAVLYK